MARGKHETIAIWPMRRCRIVVQKILPERIGNWRQAHRRAGVPGVRLLDRIDRKSSNGINTKLVEMTLLAQGVSGAGMGVPANGLRR